MGMLFRTKGTKWLVAHFNEEFSTYIRFYRTAPVVRLFDTTLPGYTSLGLISTSLVDPHSFRPDHLCLLPLATNGAGPHAHLQVRWLWFLNTANAANGSLTPANDRLLADAIHQGLTGAFDSITFDAVEIAGAQHVATAQPTDDGTLFFQIVLQTPAMPAAPPGVPPAD